MYCLSVPCICTGRQRMALLRPWTWFAEGSSSVQGKFMMNGAFSLDGIRACSTLRVPVVRTEGGKDFCLKRLSNPLLFVFAG